MFTRYVGDSFTVNGNVSRIVKVCEGNIQPTYLVVDEQSQTFSYYSDDTMAESTTSNCSGTKRKAYEPALSDSSKEKTSSASNRSLNEVQLFNIKFECPSTDEKKTRSFERFFGSSHVASAKYDSIVNLRWDDDNVLKDPKVDIVIRKLLEKAADFQIIQSEAAAENFVKDLLDYVGISEIALKVPVRFGCADLVVTRPINDEYSAQQRMVCVVQVKGASPYSAELRKKYRNQVAINMISLAIDNTLNYAADGETIHSQEVFGLLQVGLTPIFYRSEVKKDYVEAVLEYRRKGVAKVPVLVIKEFRPITRYNDREILKISSREIIFNSYENFKNLLKNAKLEVNRSGTNVEQEDNLHAIEEQRSSPHFSSI